MEKTLEIISVNAHNLAQENVCCGFSDKKHREGVRLKQEWLTARFAEGLTYKKLNVRGKIFIEYLPAEFAWSPVEAPGYMFIHCFWVSGKYKGHGWGKALLEECLSDSQEMNGIVVVTTKKVMPFLTDKPFFVKHGFEVCDTAPPYFELLVRPLKDAPLPRFTARAKTATCDPAEGFTFVYSDLCPYTTLWVENMQKFADNHGIPSRKVKLATRNDARQAPSAFTIFSIFYNSKFVTQEILTERKFEKMVKRLTV